MGCFLLRVFLSFFGLPAPLGAECCWEGGFWSFSFLFLLASWPYLYTQCVLFCAFLQVLLIHSAHLPIKK